MLIFEIIPSGKSLCIEMTDMEIKKIWLVMAFCGGFWSCCAQNMSMYLVNSSFEGERQDAVVPLGWEICELSTTPDILPDVWGVYTEPSDGDSFVGLITRADGSRESIGQRLPQLIKKGDCYKFSLDLAHSVTYAGYNDKVKVQIWGGGDKCERDQLLLDSPVIGHAFWKQYSVEFTALEDIEYLIIEVYSPASKQLRGNVMIDNISALKICPRA